MLESDLIKWLSQGTNTPCYHNIPQRPPEAFITIKRVGGYITNVTDHADIAVQTWGKTPEKACQLAYTVIRYVISNQPPSSIYSIKASSMYEYPDDEGLRGRYQVLLEIVATLGD